MISSNLSDRRKDRDGVRNEDESLLQSPLRTQVLAQKPLAAAKKSAALPSSCGPKGVRRREGRSGPSGLGHDLNFDSLLAILRSVVEDDPSARKRLFQRCGLIRCQSRRRKRGDDKVESSPCLSSSSSRSS